MKRGEKKKKELRHHSDERKKEEKREKYDRQSLKVKKKTVRLLEK